MFCSQCGRSISDAASFCRYCGFRLVSDQLRSPSPPQIIVAVPMKNPGIAAVLSFLWWGLGQIYNGQIGKGLMMMVSWPICVILFWLWCLVAAGASRDPGGGEPHTGTFLVLVGFAAVVLVWVWISGIVGAYRTAERLNQERFGG